MSDGNLLTVWICRRTSKGCRSKDYVRCVTLAGLQEKKKKKKRVDHHPHGNEPLHAYSSERVGGHGFRAHSWTTFMYVIYVKSQEELPSLFLSEYVYMTWFFFSFSLLFL